jgi:tetratricopeptide (TPR) repeat protein
MLRTNALPAPTALATARVTSLATLITFTVLATTGCGDTKPGEVKVVELIPVTDYATSAPAVVTPTAETNAVIVPENVTYRQADSAFAGRRYAQAAEMFAVISARNPKGVTGHYMLGLSSWKAGDRVRAESAFKSAIERDPKHAKSRLNLARVLLEVERPKEALEQVEKVLETDSTSAEMFRLLGRVRSELREVEPALAAYRKAIVLDEKDVWSMNNMALILIQKGRYAEALGPLARATELKPESALFQNNLGIVLERTGHFAAATTAFKAALAADSAYGKAGVSLARVEGRVESPTLTAVDLSMVAKAFATEVRGGEQGPVVMAAPPPTR